MSTEVPATPAIDAAARPGRRLVAVCSLVVLAIAIAGYAWTGTPAALTGQVPVEAAQGDEAQRIAEFNGMVEKLRVRMETEPSAEGLAMLGRSYLVLGKPPEAVAAYQRALKLKPQDASLLADMADAMGVQNGNTLTGAPMAFVEQSLRLDPKNLKALMLAGSEAFDRNDHRAAIGYWQRMVDTGPAEHPLVQQAGQGIQESRRLLAGGTPGGPAGPVAAAATPAAPAAPAAAAASASVRGTVTLAAAVRGQASPEDTVFIFARPAEGSRMPLAILRRQVKDLPVDFVLDDSLAMSPAARLSGAGTVIVGARVSKSGNAMPQPGDLEGLSAPVAVGTQGLRIEIGQVVR